MKHVFLALVTLVATTAQAQWSKVTGNGNLKTESRQVASFDGISLSGSVDVELSYGNSNTVTVEADENLLEYIETTVENNTLIIKTKNKWGISSRNRMVVKATMTTIEEIRVSGSGNVSGAGAFKGGSSTSIALSGSGNIKLSIGAVKALSIAVSGSGNINLKGESAQSIAAKISGSGNIDCADIQTDDVDAAVSGSGNVRVYANKSITARVSGSGNIYYRGSATNISLKSSGSGKVIKA